MSDALLSSFTPENFRAVLHEAGYRAELMSDRPNGPYLRSATGGVPFEVQFVNKLANSDGYADVTLAVIVRVEGKLPLAAVNDWNNGRRFGRLRLVGEVVILDMDVSAVGGVTPTHLRTLIGIWDQLAQDATLHLRNTLARLGAQGQGAGPAVAPLPASGTIPAEGAASPRPAAKSLN
ncbi:MAG TPA: YbjN domain-containing protein [Stellaceae bacterium]|nr:YbjN domain-containing protein [Stellaceae bacterium]